MDTHCELSWRSSQPAYPGKVDRRESGYSPGPADVDAMGVFGSCDPQAQRLNQSGKSTKEAVLKPSGFNRAQVGQRGFGTNSIRIEQVGMLPVSVVPSGVNMRMGIGRLSQKLHDTSASTAGQGPAVHLCNRWAPEPSVLVLGLSREAARRLGERWEQNAIVWAGADAIPELMLLR